MKTNFSNPIGNIAGEWVVINSRSNPYVEFWWPNYKEKKSFLVSLKDGSRKVLEKSNSYVSACYFSPKQKYLVYYNGKDYLCYDLNSGRNLNLTESIIVPLSHVSEYDNLPGEWKDLPLALVAGCQTTKHF